MTAETSDPTYAYGNNYDFLAERIRIFTLPGTQEFVNDVIRLVPITIERADYEQALEDINNSWKVITDTKTGKQFEIAETNPNASDGYDAEISTYSSSISGNRGNAVEFAERSALHPDRRRLYIAGLGNGKSSYWESLERQH